MRMKLAVLAPLLLLAGQLRAAPRVIAVNVDGVVHPVTVEILSHSLEKAQRENAALVLIRLNTPGGLMEATRHAIEKIVASPVPVVTYVTPSGGRARRAMWPPWRWAPIRAQPRRWRWAWRWTR